MSDPYNTAPSKKDPWRQVPVKKDRSRTRNPVRISKPVRFWELRYASKSGGRDGIVRVRANTYKEALARGREISPRLTPRDVVLIEERRSNPLDPMTALNAAGDIAMMLEFAGEKKAGAFKAKPRRKNPFGAGVCPPHLKKFRFRKVR